MPQSDIKLLRFNVRSILAKDRRDALVRALIPSNFYVIALTETWWTPDFADSELPLETFHLYRKEKKTTTLKTWRRSFSC